LATQAPRAIQLSAETTQRGEEATGKSQNPGTQSFGWVHVVANAAPEKLAAENKTNLKKLNNVSFRRNI
jgi:hypothetical protein